MSERHSTMVKSPASGPLNDQVIVVVGVVDIGVNRSEGHHQQTLAPSTGSASGPSFSSSKLVVGHLSPIIAGGSFASSDYVDGHSDGRGPFGLGGRIRGRDRDRVGGTLAVYRSRSPT